VSPKNVPCFYAIIVRRYSIYFNKTYYCTHCILFQNIVNIFYLKIPHSCAHRCMIWIHIIRIGNRHHYNGCIGKRIVNVYHNILYYIMHIRTNYSSNATLTILNKCRLPYEIHHIYILCTGEVRFYNVDAAIYYTQQFLNKLNRIRWFNNNVYNIIYYIINYIDVTFYVYPRMAAAELL